ncbi:Flp pilus assembly protein CpaB [Arthrobacter halodurans]|uniref:Flp pilus assembly protein CpaB n=1 Tax=Arthrobacter halodurans TaxID=516699 RepID=A0ABV4ULJ6_9MICC
MALVLAIVGTVLLLTYVKAADARAQASLSPVEVLVATADIAAGTPIGEAADSLTRKTLPNAAVTDGAVESLDGHDGQVLAHDLVAGEQLLTAKLIAEDALLVPGTIPVPTGLQEVTVVLEPERVVGGKLRAGDQVGLYGNYTVKEKNSDDDDEVKLTKLLYDKVLVTAIQVAPGEVSTETAEGTTALPTGSAYVTLAADSTQAAKIIHTREFGSLWLTKQNDDTKAGNTKVWDINEVLK